MASVQLEQSQTLTHFGDQSRYVLTIFDNFVKKISSQITAQEMEDSYPSQLGSLLRCGE